MFVRMLFNRRVLFVSELQVAIRKAETAKEESRDNRGKWTIFLGGGGGKGAGGVRIIINYCSLCILENF